STFLSESHLAPSCLHSFPTRRSSDLRTEPLIQRRNPRPRITERALFTLRQLHVRGLSGTNRIRRRRLRSRQTQVGVRHLRHRSKDRKSTRLNSSHVSISYAVFCLKKK